jgi:hypothetical protein
MRKVIDFSRRKKATREPGEFERCVICGCQTNVRTDEPVELRRGYLEGAGQLCHRCYLDISRQS